LKWAVTLLLLSNVGMSYYFTQVHKRGVIDVVRYLRNEVYSGNVHSIVFLMPCHSTPFYSYIHKNVPMRFVTCEPPLGYLLYNDSAVDRKTYQHETSLLYENPEKFISTYFDVNVGNKTNLYPNKYESLNVGPNIPRYSWPSHLVWYDNAYLRSTIEGFLKESNYRTVNND
jgi:phosphatidylinositol glycan class B